MIKWNKYLILSSAILVSGVLTTLAFSFFNPNFAPKASIDAIPSPKTSSSGGSSSSPIASTQPSNQPDNSYYIHGTVTDADTGRLLEKSHVTLAKDGVYVAAIDAQDGKYLFSVQDKGPYNLAGSAVSLIHQVIYCSKKITGVTATRPKPGTLRDLALYPIKTATIIAHNAENGHEISDIQIIISGDFNGQTKNSVVGTKYIADAPCPDDGPAKAGFNDELNPGWVMENGATEDEETIQPNQYQILDFLLRRSNDPYFGKIEDFKNFAKGKWDPKQRITIGSCTIPNCQDNIKKAINKAGLSLPKKTAITATLIGPGSSSGFAGKAIPKGEEGNYYSCSTQRLGDDNKTDITFKCTMDHVTPGDYIVRNQASGNVELKYNKKTMTIPVAVILEQEITVESGQTAKASWSSLDGYRLEF